MLYHLIALTLAYFIDLAVGDPPHWPHPVKGFGKLIALLEKSLNKGNGRKVKGAIMLAIVLLFTGCVTFVLIWLCYRLHPAAGIAAEAVCIAAAIAQKSLKEAAATVYTPLAAGNLDDARLKLSYIVGRDTEQLDEPEIVRGTVETVAENTSDGITAPLFWALLGGAPFALMYRAINTCDSMVGYRNERYEAFGWASAKLDDAVNWIPSRITALCMLIAKKPLYTSRKQAWKIMMRDARKHPSPNSGWGEAAAAAILGIQLGGINHYKGIVSNRAKMGDPLISLEKKHIVQANEIVTGAVLLFMLMLWAGGMLFEMAFTWS